LPENPHITVEFQGSLRKLSKLTTWTRPWWRQRSECRTSSSGELAKVNIYWYTSSRNKNKDKCSSVVRLSTVDDLNILIAQVVRTVFLLRIV